MTATSSTGPQELSEVTHSPVVGSSRKKKKKQEEEAESKTLE